MSTETITLDTLKAELRRRYARWERCCAWVAARVTPDAPLTPEGLCPFTPLPGYSIEEIRSRSDELGPMILAICEEAERLGLSASDLMD